MDDMQFYETPRFAVALALFCLAAACVLTVFGVRMKDLSWLFVLAWVFMIPVFVILYMGIKPIPRRVCTTASLILCAVFLRWLDVKFPGGEEPKITPIISWFPASPLEEGEPLTSAQLDASAYVGNTAVDGEFLYDPALGSTLPVGVDTLKVTFTSREFLPVTKTATVEVKASPTHRTVATPLPIVVGFRVDDQYVATFTNSSQFPISDITLDQSWYSFLKDGRGDSHTLVSSSYLLAPSARQDKLDTNGQSTFDLKKAGNFYEDKDPASPEFSNHMFSFYAFRFAFRDSRTGEKFYCYQIISTELHTPTLSQSISGMKGLAAYTHNAKPSSFFEEVQKTILDMAGTIYTDKAKPIGCEN